MECPIALNEAASCYFERRDEAAMNDVIWAAAGLIRYYARLYGGALDPEDLFQTGSLGLVKALSGYDPSKAASFVTYASHCIIGEIRHLVRKESSYYRPGCIAELQFQVDGIIEAYLRREGDVPPVSYIAQTLNVRPESVDEVMRAGLVRFDEIDTAKIHSQNYETFRLPIEDRLALAHAARKLSTLQWQVLHLLFYGNLSQQQVADKMGLSQRKVSRIKQRSLEILREDMMNKQTNKK